MQHKRYIVIDIARVVAISLVAFTHIFQSVGNREVGGFFGIKNFYWVSWGGVGVTVFLIISGLSLEINHGFIKQSWSKFMYLRVKKIYPTYWVALLFSIGIYVINMMYTFGKIFPPGKWTLPELSCSLVGICAFFSMWGGPFTNTAWFIGLIISLYAFFPTLSQSVKKHPWFTLVFTLTLSVISRLLIGPFNSQFYRPIDWFPTARLGEFTLGIFLANQIPLKQWAKLKLPPRLNRTITAAAKLSFPFFLVHHPLLFIIPHTIKIGLPFALSVAVYLTVAIAVAHQITILFKS